MLLCLGNTRGWVKILETPICQKEQSWRERDARNLRRSVLHDFLAAQSPSTWADHHGGKFHCSLNTLLCILVAHKWNWNQLGISIEWWVEVVGNISYRNIASFSDGEPGNSTGTPFFYLSKLDPTPNDLERDPRCSFSLSEAPIGTCGSTDVENPTCARLTLTGKVSSCSFLHEVRLQQKRRSMLWYLRWVSIVWWGGHNDETLCLQFGHS